MLNQSLRLVRSGTSNALRAFAALLIGCMMVSVNAQETTSTLRGSITDASGSPVSGATVTVTDTRNGSRRTLTSNSAGRYTVGGLRVGGPYTVEIDAPGQGKQTITDVSVALGSTATLPFTFVGEAMEEVVTTAVAVQSANVAIGPATSFNLADLENLPAINRDIKDVIRVDPRIYIDEADVDGIQCNGASSRFNSTTVDGIKLNDDFGLNRNGYPGQRQPFPFDAIEQVSVELAPFDVQYGGFTACNINAVTKSGENEFHGSFFYDYTSDSFVGDSLEGDDIELGDFDEKRYGLTIGGPILQDKLFFLFSYEKNETADLFDRCAGDATCGRPVEGVSQAQIDRIASIARNIYNYDPGEPIFSSPQENEKILAKFDWNINDQHRANLTYLYNDGSNLSNSDGDDNEFEFANHRFDRGTETTMFTTSLYSDWSDNFSTEVRFGNITNDNSQVTRNGVGFPEFRVETYADIDGDGDFTRANVFLGGDDSRQSNKLDYESNTIKLVGSYVMDNHVISGGFEQQNLDIANLFLQHSIGEYRFDEMCNPGNPDGCIDALEALSPDDIYYGNAAGTNNPQDAAGALEYAINTAYIQDEVSLMGDDLQIVFGLRYDWYSSDDLPTNNPNFVARNGFTNATNFDGEGLLQPRFGFNYDVNDRLSVRGGIGLYSGGNPNVWLTNNYQVDGITQVQAREFNVGLSDLNVTDESLATVPLSGSGRPGYDIPQAFVDFVADGTANSGVNALDPDFKIPGNWKFALGASYDFDMPGRLGTDYHVDADIQISRGVDSAIVRDTTLARVGIAPDGRPIYRSVDFSDPDCADLNSPDCGNRRFNQDFVLGNVSGSDATATSFSFALRKEYDFGLDWSLGYAYVEAEDVNPMTSSVAFSNFVNVATSDPNDPGRAVSNYQIPQRVTLRVSYVNQFFGDYDTRFTLFGSSNKGRPYSYVFDDNDGGVFGDSLDGRHLFYMPTGTADPNVQFGPDFDTDDFFAFADANGLAGYAGQIVPRNAFDSPWWTKFDLRISQDLPGFRKDDRAQAFFVIENLTNLLNDDWGVLEEVGFPRTQGLVDLGYDAANNQYIFNSFNEPSGPRRQTDASLWSARIGIKYSF